MPQTHSQYNRHPLKTSLHWALVGVLVWIGWAGSVQAQTDPQFYQYPQNHLNWYTLESDHFMVHFQEGSDRSARQIAVIAEEVYPGITDLYQHEPDQKVSIVLQDREDYSNGAAYFFDNKIDIWVPALDTPFRGYHHWLRNVISHEFTHIVQIQAGMKRNRHIPAWYLQWLSYEDVRRPDVLYGYPNALFTYPLASVSIPAWLAEGTAQFQRNGWKYEQWDNHRDMLLRTRILDDNYLRLDEMGTFASKNSLERELVYNQGYAFTYYLAQRLGEPVLSEITATAAQSSKFDISDILEEATDIPADSLFEDWITSLETHYQAVTNQLAPTPADTIEDQGFLNMNPRYHPDGSLFYLTNRGQDYSILRLISSHAADSTANHAFRIPLPNNQPGLSCGFQSRALADRISGSYDIHPDGSQLVYSKAQPNKWGERYNDLYLIHLDQPNRDPQQLTQRARLSDPAWAPDGKTIAAVQERDGSQNLVLYRPANDSLTILTDFQHGEQLFTPRWHPDGTALFISYGDTTGRHLYRFELAQNEMHAVPLGWDRTVDIRDPAVGPHGRYLYFAAAPHGIFNIYRTPLRGSGQPEQLTQVLGGAFMPAVSPEGKLTYASYTSTGYKLVSTSLDEALSFNLQHHYGGAWIEQSEPLTSNYPYPGYHADPKQPDPLNPQLFNQLRDTTRYIPSYGSWASHSDSLALRIYDGTATDFSFYPVIRFDNYSRINGPNGQLIRNGKLGALGENLWRDAKVGFYVGSREVIERFSIFGGALFGFGSQEADGIGDFFQPSRLVDLDRDLFLIAEYRGLPFIERRWSPTISIELYNQRRNVKDGLSVEEFPCTSCLPDTTNTDIAYDIWEADFYLRSKINRWSLVELGIGYSPYRVTTEGFVSREFKQFVPGSTSQYFKGTMLTAGYIFDFYRPYRHSDIAPLGWRGEVRYTYQPSRLLDNYELNDGILSPIYAQTKNHSVELDVRYNHRLPSNLTAQLHTRFFSYLNNPDDYFYLDYIGGFSGMRSYPFYGIGGNTTSFSQLSLYTPIVTALHQQVGRFTLDKLYVRWFAEAGNGWRGPYEVGNNLKTGVGAELRFAFSSYYLFPLKLFISGSYGLNEFSATLPEEFVTNQQDNRVQYGGEMLFHVGMTFDFEALGKGWSKLW
ncbi:MAG: hypothetical protein ACQETE_14820 [Bacteroidota bacterium]